MILWADIYQPRTRSRTPTSYQVLLSCPPSFFQESYSKALGRVLQDHFRQGATPLCFPIDNDTCTFPENQQTSGDSGTRDLLSEALAIFSHP